MVHAEHAVGQVADAIVAVLGDQDREAAVGEAPQLAHQLAGAVVVELGGRLIEQQDGGLGSEDGGEGDALALTGRQLVDAPTGQVLRLDARERRPRGGQDLLGRAAVALEAEGHVAHWLGHHGLGLGVLEEKAHLLGQLGRRGRSQVEAADSTAASRLATMEGGGQPGQHAQEGRLAAARDALQQQDLARLDRQRGPVQRPRAGLVVAVAQPLDRDRAHARHRRARAPSSDTSSTTPASTTPIGLRMGPASG